MMNLSLAGKRILVTGVSRSQGIGAQITRLLSENGAQVVVHGYAAYDAAMGYTDAFSQFAEELLGELREKGRDVTAIPPSDLSVPGEGEAVIQRALEKAGPLDGLVLNHAYSTSLPLGQWTEEDIGKHLTVNVLASMMMIQAFSRQLPAGKRGAVTLFTSGQYLGPMTKEIPYAVSKEAIIGLCKQAAVALAPQNIQVNCINPGPTDTGYLFGEDYEAVARMFPGGRWGMPEDAARLVHFLQSDYSAWITGEVIASEGGFRRG
jgi:3-oxoacyl-[acyl-carrier protein] reductase